MIICFGELLWDLFPSGKKLGGALANCCYRLSELGNDTRLISRIGNDSLGNEAIRILNEKGLSTELIQIDKKFPTGIVEIEVSPNGDAEYNIIKNVSYDFIEVGKDILDLAESSECFIFGNLIQRNIKSRNSLYELTEATHFSLKVIDLNLRKDCFTKETIIESLNRANVLKLNNEEVEVVKVSSNLSTKCFEGFCEKIANKYSLDSILITLAEKGVYAFDIKEGHCEIEGYPSTVVDTVGAGDNFTAGFIHKRLHGSNFFEACEFANILGALATSKSGGMPEISHEEILNYKNQIRRPNQ